MKLQDYIGGLAKAGYGPPILVQLRKGETRAQAGARCAMSEAEQESRGFVMWPETEIQYEAGNEDC